MFTSRIKTTVRRWNLQHLLILLLAGQAWAAISKDDIVDNSIATFAVKVYEKFSRRHSGNILLCPVSVQTALTLTAEGGVGRTAHEMVAALYLPQDRAATRQYFSEFMKTVRASNSENLQLLIANKIFTRKNFKVSPDYKNLASQYDADIESIDFGNRATSAAKINDWVALRTKNEINNLISPTDLTLYTQLLIINALYFNGKWQRSFDPKLTTKEPFYLTKTQQTPVDMMKQKARLRYTEDGELDCQIVSIPYHGYEYSLTIALPKRKDGLRYLEDMISQVIHVANNDLYSADVNLTLPKFHLEDKADYVDILKELGMNDAFSDKADFRGIGAQGDRLSISKVVSKAVMSVSEEGTVAAAASAIGAVTLSIPVSVPEVTVTVDHPFLFFISSRQHNAPLFIGRVVTP